MIEEKIPESVLLKIIVYLSRFLCLVYCFILKFIIVESNYFL